MTALPLLLRGVIAGLAIAIPVGPVNVLCASRTISKGWKSGVVSGLGAAAADALYGSIAAFSIRFVIDMLIREQYRVRFFGGLLLIGLGLLYIFKKARPVSGPRQTGASHSDLVSAFLLTMTNPTTVLSFLAVLAALRLEQRHEWWLTVFLVAGIFLGSMIWWIVLTAIVYRLRDRFNDRAMVWMNRVAGIAILVFGVLSMTMAKAPR